MFAVIKTGGKQYKVAADDVVKIEKLAGEAGETVTFPTVLMLGGESVTVGDPTVAGATVSGQIVEQTRGPKTISFKKRRRQNSKRKKGHRQHLTIVRITDILPAGAAAKARDTAATGSTKKTAKAAAAEPVSETGAL